MAKEKIKHKKISDKLFYDRIAGTERAVDILNETVVGIDTRLIVENVIGVVIVILLIIISAHTYSINSKLPSLQVTKPIEESAYIGEGKVERIGVDSVMVENVVYNNICNSDLEVLRLGDHIVIEDSGMVDGAWGQCDKYRLTIQE